MCVVEYPRLVGVNTEATDRVLAITYEVSIIAAMTGETSLLGTGAPLLPNRGICSARTPIVFSVSHVVGMYSVRSACTGVLSREGISCRQQCRHSVDTV